MTQIKRSARYILAINHGCRSPEKEVFAQNMVAVRDRHVASTKKKGRRDQRDTVCKFLPNDIDVVDADGCGGR